MMPLVILLSVLIGVSLGLLGGGGSILTVPILVYVAGVDAKAAIATSLLVVAATSAAGVVSHARAGRVRFRTGAIFGAAGMVGAYAGGRLAAFIPGVWLLVGFGLMMLATGFALLRGRGDQAPRVGELPVARVLLDGVIVGLVTGLVGAGGGFLVVPALVLLGGMPMNIAVGTSLFVIALKSSAGFVGYLHSVQIDWMLALTVTAAAIVGSFFGARLVGRISEAALRRGFAGFVLLMAVVILVKELPAELGLRLGALSALGVGAATLSLLAALAGRMVRSQT
ncbi:MAG: sulfite exporter TauE/SafE family protein [Polyangiaceae bacterium]